MAVLTGDFLFARASHILADLGPEAVRIQAEAFERLVTGQILETAGPRDGRDPVDHYLDVLGGKTGSLVAVSCRFGAMMSGADETVVDVLTQYGERLGVAFQLADDVLDIASDSPRVRQDPRHRPARGHPDPAGAAAARTGGRGWASAEDIALCELLDSDLTDDARHARGAGPPAGPPGAGTGPPRHRALRARTRAPRWPRCPSATRSWRWMECATRWCTAPAERRGGRAGSATRRRLPMTPRGMGRRRLRVSYRRSTRS